MANSGEPFDSSNRQWEKLKPLEREMRSNPTASEGILWQKIRNRAILGAKFRRQHAIDRFIVDFVCLEHSLVIEVDGDSHATKTEYDRLRQDVLEARGFRVLRFTDEDVLRNTYHVLEHIRRTLEGMGG